MGSDPDIRLDGGWRPIRHAMRGRLALLNTIFDKLI